MIASQPAQGGMLSINPYSWENLSAGKSIRRNVTTNPDCSIRTMSIMANRFNKIRAALCTTNFMAQMAREHNNANVLCIGARVLDNEKSKSIVNIFLNTEFDKENPRHKIRVDMFD